MRVSAYPTVRTDVNTVRTENTELLDFALFPTVQTDLTVRTEITQTEYDFIPQQMSSHLLSQKLKLLGTRKWTQSFIQSYLTLFVVKPCLTHGDASINRDSQVDCKQKRRKQTKNKCRWIKIPSIISC